MKAHRTATKARPGRRPRSSNPHLTDEMLACENEDVRQLAEVFNTVDPHSRRALFQWACDFTGVPRAMVQSVHDYLRAEAIKQARAAEMRGAR